MDGNTSISDPNQGQDNVQSQGQGSAGNTTWASIQAAVVSRLHSVKEGVVHIISKLRDYIKNIKDNNTTEPDYSDLPIDPDHDITTPQSESGAEVPQEDVPSEKSVPSGDDQPAIKDVDAAPSDETPSDNTVDDNDVSEPEPEGSGRELTGSYMPMKGMDFSDIDTSNLQAYESQHLVNMAAIKFAQAHSVMVDGETSFDVDDLSERLDSFTDYATAYANIKERTSSGIEFDNAMKSLQGMPNYAENNRIMSEILEEQQNFLDEIRDASDRGVSNTIAICRKYPTAAFAGGDISYDEYTEYLDDRRGLGVDLLNDGDDKKNSELVDITENENNYDPLTIRNLARIRFAKSMSKEGAFDMDALDEKMKLFDEHAKHVDDYDDSDASAKTDSAFKEMYDTCKADVDKFKSAESAKHDEALKIPVSSGQDATMKYFYEDYSDPDIVYAAGRIDRETYESKLTTNLIGLSADDFKDYVANARASQADEVAPQSQDADFDID